MRSGAISGTLSRMLCSARRPFAPARSSSALASTGAAIFAALALAAAGCSDGAGSSSSATGGSGGAGGGGGTTTTTTITGPPGWVLAWSDEFDGPDGSAPDSVRWTTLEGGDVCGNEERQYYTADP